MTQKTQVVCDWCGKDESFLDEEEERPESDWIYVERGTRTYDFCDDDCLGSALPLDSA